MPGLDDGKNYHNQTVSEMTNFSHEVREGGEETFLGRDGAPRRPVLECDD